MKFINRQEELRRLRALSQPLRGGMVTLYGRRRVGKTRLLLQWLSQCDSVLFTADQSSPSIQRAYFSKALDTAFPGFSQATYPHWNAFFDRLSAAIHTHDWSGVLAIDELPYLVETCPELPSILQHFVDTTIKNSRVILAISGSSRRMMHGIVLDGSAPLFGRSDVLLRLRPIHISYMKNLFPAMSDLELFKMYALFGGVPKYWELVNSCGLTSIDAVIDELVLNYLGPLHQEPDRLLTEEKGSTLALRQILDSIGTGAHRVSEIAGRIGLPATSLSRPLSALIDMDILYKELPYGDNEKKSKKSLYKIADPFFRFWFRVVAPNRSFFLSSGKKQRTALFHHYAPALYSLSFENLCRQVASNLISSIAECKDMLFMPAGRFWSGNGPEWDIVAVSTDQKHLFLGEVKWKEKKPTRTDIHHSYRSLLTKGLPPLKKINTMTVHYAVFVPEKPSGYCLGKEFECTVFDLGDGMKCAAAE